MEFLFLAILAMLHTHSAVVSKNYSSHWFVNTKGQCLYARNGKLAVTDDCQQYAAAEWIPEKSDNSQGHYYNEAVPHCLNREHCHSSTSNARVYDCGHCGSKHWRYNNDNGHLCEDDCKNCLHESGDQISHCSGFKQRMWTAYPCSPGKGALVRNDGVYSCKCADCAAQVYNGFQEFCKKECDFDECCPMFGASLRHNSDGWTYQYSSGNCSGQPFASSLISPLPYQGYCTI